MNLRIEFYHKIIDPDFNQDPSSPSCDDSHKSLVVESRSQGVSPFRFIEIPNRDEIGGTLLEIIENILKGKGLKPQNPIIIYQL